MMKSEHQAWFETHQYGILLATLLTVYALYPFVGTRPSILALLQLAVLIMMGTAIASFWRNRVAFVSAILLGIAVQVAQSVHRFTDLPTKGIVAAAFEMGFYGVIIYAIAGRLFRMEKITMNAVFGVCSIYLLIAIAWASIYTIIEKAQPGSFNRPKLASELYDVSDEEDSDLLYFSLITMTTVGYGDITPATPPARTLSALQGVIGQLFLATVLARIVSMEIGDRMAARQARFDKKGPPSGTGGG